MFFRVKPARHYRYLQIARSVRVDGKVRQEIIATLGRLDVLEASGQLERLLRSEVLPADSGPRRSRRWGDQARLDLQNRT